VALLARLQAASGLEVEVLCSRAPGTKAHERVGGVRVTRCAAPVRVASTPLPAALPVALWRSRADLVHLHWPWPPGELAALLAARGRPLVVSWHCDVVRYPRLVRLLAPLTRRTLAAAARIVVGSEALGQQGPLAGLAAQLRVIPFGVDLERFRPAPQQGDPAPSSPHPRILFVGSLRHYKGLGVLAAALARLPEAHLVVIGEGPERARFEAALDALGCGARALLLGSVEERDLVRHLQHADAAVLCSTSRAEAFGLALAEAQACGVPAVTTELGTGTAQVLQDGVSGRVVPPCDPEALARALRWCLDPAQRAARRAAARAHAERRLDAERMHRELLALYAELLPRPASRSSESVSSNEMLGSQPVSARILETSGSRRRVSSKPSPKTLA
jgi:rhamnosyl/mannosyltransferase